MSYKPIDNNSNNSNNKEINTSHPVFKKLSKVNGSINYMTIEELGLNLSKVGLEVSGSIESCKKRLKHYYKSEAMSKVFKKNITYYYDVICIVDFEAICEKDNEDVVQEIIEFPAHMVDVKQKKIVSSFHEFVKPKTNNKLSEFCVNLTGISQSVVDNSDSFPDVLDKFEIWFHNFIKDNNITSFALATDGPWDMSHFFASTCKLYNIAYPSYAKRWINIRKVFSSHYKTQQLSLDQMLAYLGIEFEGRKHSGYDDAINIANTLIRMIIDGANPVVNERISWHQSDRYRWGNLRYGFVRVFYNKPSDGLNVSDSEDSITEDINEELEEEKRSKILSKN